ncbi:MAG: nodulation protein NfeD, partial [Verrucomicrobiaceae bacterium]
MNMRWWLLLLAIALNSLPVLAAESGPVVVVPIKTEISSAQFFFLRRALKEAERDGASAFVIEMDTYGGEVKAAI